MMSDLRPLILLPFIGASLGACATGANSQQTRADVRPYTITFRNFSADETLSVLSAIETDFAGFNDIGELEGSPPVWRQNIRSSLNSSELARALHGELGDMGLSETEVRLTVREQGQIEIAKLGLKQVR